MTSQEQAQRQREHNRVKWDRFKARAKAWKALQADFSLPRCQVCGDRFRPEDAAQTACSSLCVRRFVVRESVKRAQHNGRK